jgi:hypothetical protein
MANLEEIRYAQMIAGENAVIARLKLIGLVPKDEPIEEEIEQDVCDYCGVIQCVGISCQDF